MSEIIPFLEGHLTLLRGLTEADLDGPMPQWSNDREVTRMLYRGAFPETRATAGIRDNLIRLAIGLEEVEDIRTDLQRGLSAIDG